MAAPTASSVIDVERLALGPYRQLPGSTGLNIAIVYDVCSTWTDGLLLLASPKRVPETSYDQPCVLLYEWDASLTHVSELLNQGPSLRSAHKGLIGWDDACCIHPLNEQQQTYVVVSTLRDQRPLVDNQYPCTQVSCVTLAGHIIWTIDVAQPFRWPKVVGIHHGFIGIFYFGERLIIVHGATGAVSMLQLPLLSVPMAIRFADDGLLYAWRSIYEMEVFRLSIHESSQMTAAHVRSVNMRNFYIGGPLRFDILTHGYPTLISRSTCNLYLFNKVTGKITSVIGFPDFVTCLHLDRRGRLVGFARGHNCCHIYVYMS